MYFIYYLFCTNTIDLLHLFWFGWLGKQMNHLLLKEMAGVCYILRCSWLLFMNGACCKPRLLELCLVLVSEFYNGSMIICVELRCYTAVFLYLEITMRTNLPKLLDLLIFCIYSLNFSLEFFIMIFFVTYQLNISKFLPLQRRKTLISY